MLREVPVNKDNRELVFHGTAQYPLQINHDSLCDFRDGFIRLHWHDEVEFSIVRQGTALYTLGSGAYLLHEGEGLLINAQTPHSIRRSSEENVHLLTIIVHPMLIYGQAGSILERDLFRPFLQCASLSTVPMNAEEIADCIEIDRISTERSFAYELRSLHLFCSLFYSVLTREQAHIRSPHSTRSIDLNRLEILLAYLHLHYDEPLNLAALANHVSISRESCCRFFKRMTGQTLSQYLEEYRVSHALKLLEEGKYAITELALLTGFSSAGRFSAVFKDRMGCTPREHIARLNRNNHTRSDLK